MLTSPFGFERVQLALSPKKEEGWLAVTLEKLDSTINEHMDSFDEFLYSCTNDK